MDNLSFIIDNQLTMAKWADIYAVIEDHEQLIRDMAGLVLDEKAGRGEERKKYLGLYYEEVQQKVNWVCATAEDVWAGKYGNDEERKEKLGADYDVVMKQVNKTAYLHGAKITISKALTFASEDGGKIYVYKNVPSSRGPITMYGYAQHKLGQAPWKFDGSGCGFLSFFSIIKTAKGYTLSPAEYANKMMKKAGGTNCPISLSVGLNMLKEEGISYEWYKRYTTQELVAKVKSHLLTGNPVIMSLYKDNRAGVEDKRYTRYAHYAVLTHLHADGKKAWLNDSGSKMPRLVDLYDICDHCPQAREGKIDFDPIWNGWTNCGGAVFVKY
jgi:hypothetical protein